jgi:catechol 2,3-dioxygenase-like lactoylglutathione lyase family enzyme
MKNVRTAGPNLSRTSDGETDASAAFFTTNIQGNRPEQDPRCRRALACPSVGSTRLNEENAMIQRVSHITVYVLDQESAYDFYVNKAGFEVRTDMQFGDSMRWLTVSPKGQPDLEIVLMPIEAVPNLTPERADMLRELVKSGTFGAGVLETDDAQRDYAELTAKGVEFTQPPEEQFYGIEALFRDDSGNFFSLTQRTTK